MQTHVSVIFPKRNYLLPLPVGQKFAPYTPLCHRTTRDQPRRANNPLITTFPFSSFFLMEPLAEQPHTYNYNPTPPSTQAQFHRPQYNVGKLLVELGHAPDLFSNCPFLSKSQHSFLVGPAACSSPNQATTQGGVCVSHRAWLQRRWPAKHNYRGQQQRIYLHLQSSRSDSLYQGGTIYRAIETSKVS